MGGGTELIFVEGHSRDDTWAAIQSVAAGNPHRAIKISSRPARARATPCAPASPRRPATS
jgi:hypothetical protein